jgi:hypothetical protein
LLKIFLADEMVEPGRQTDRHFMKRFILIASLALAVCQSPAAEPGTSLFLQQAYEQLISVRFFAFGEVSDAWTLPRVCTTSPGERAFNTLVASTNGLPWFKAVLTNGTTAARLYALIGIRHLAPEQFDVFAAPILATNTPVGFRMGDIGMRMEASNIVAEIKKGSYEDFCPSKSSR